MRQETDFSHIRHTLHERAICVLIPTYNNAGTIRNVVEGAKRYSDDIIVVDDGSDDGTSDILRSMDGIHLVSCKRNCGKGHALKCGFNEALGLGFAYAITMDADGQHSPDDIPAFLEANQQWPGSIVLGNRRKENIVRSKGSDFANSFSNFWFFVETLQRVPDTQTGFRLYPLTKLHGYRLITSRYEAELELIVFAAWHGVKIHSIPINVYYPPKEERVSNFRPGLDFTRISILNTLLCVLALVYGLPLFIIRKSAAALRKLRASLFVLPFMLMACFSQVYGQVNIWEGTRTKHRVDLTAYRAKGDNCPAIVVCPGGSYFWHDMESEGHAVGKWLQANGISAFVLRYRTGYVPAFVTHYRLLLRGNRYPDPQDDLRQALRHIRQNAAAYGIDTMRIGVMGFSAGGHLVMSSVELFPKAEWPAFIVPIYPVVTMTAPCVHKRSRRGLLGDSREHNRKLCDSLSLERHVPQGCPPVFLVNCKDDPIVNPHNAELLDSALTANGVSHRFIQYKTGGHGFGASSDKGTDECRQWKNEFLAWLGKLIF